MAGDILRKVHREQVPAATGTWNVRPSGLSGITPVAVWAFGTVANGTTDDSALADAGGFFGMSDGTAAYCNGYSSDDASAAANTRGCGSGIDLAYIRNFADSADDIELDIPSFVSGGLNVNVTTNTVRPYVTFVFFYGADYQVHAERTAGIASGTRTITHSFSANTDNQIAVFLRVRNAGTPNAAKWNSIGGPMNIGMACRNGAAGAPSAQASVTHWSSDARGSCLVYDNAYSSRCIRNPSDLGALSTDYECTDISDSTITLTHRSGANQFGCYTMVLGTDNKKVYCGLGDSPTTSTWTVSAPNFETQLAFAAFSQCSNDQSAFETSDVGIGGYWAGDDTAQGCATWSDKDAAADMVAKNLQSAKLNVLEDDGTAGWTAASAGDFSLTSTGWEVTNVTGPTVSGARKWLLFALEGAAGAGPETGTLTDGATAIDVFVGTASAFGLLSDAVNAAEIQSGVATALAEFADGSLVDSIYGGSAIASAGITDSVGATDGDVPTASAVGVTVESAEAQLLIEALAQAVGAILAAAQAGEAWATSLAGLVGNILEAATADEATQATAQAGARIEAFVNAGEAWVAEIVGVEVGEVSANTQASEAFSSAAQTIASIVQTASAGEIMIAFAQALSRISEAANASDAFTALVAGLLGEFSESASADAEILSRADVVASMFDGGAANDVFTGEIVAAPLGEVLAAISAEELFSATATVAAALSAGALAGAVFSALEPTESLGHLIIGAISLRATLMGIGALNPAIVGKPSVN